MNSKGRLREEFLTIRAAVAIHQHTVWSEALCGHLLEKCMGTNRIFAFYPAKGEPDILPLIRQLIRSGKEVALPAIRNGKMAFHTVQNPDLTFTESVFGIPQPDPDLPLCEQMENQDIVLTPGVAFTAAGARLGYGGGYYDRFLSRFPGTSIGIAFAVQLTNSIPAFDHDRRVDYICTEEGLSRRLFG